jgi:hypothetical protein
MSLVGNGHTGESTIAPVIYNDVTRSNRFVYALSGDEFPQPGIQRLDALNIMKIAQPPAADLMLPPP